MKSSSARQTGHIHFLDSALLIMSLYIIASSVKPLFKIYVYNYKLDNKEASCINSVHTQKTMHAPFAPHKLLFIWPECVLKMCAPHAFFTVRVPPWSYQHKGGNRTSCVNQSNLLIDVCASMEETLKVSGIMATNSPRFSRTPQSMAAVVSLCQTW